MFQGRKCMVVFLSIVMLLGLGCFSLPVSAQEADLTVNSDLQIDGYYDDWEGYPVTEITYMSNNTYSIHVGQLYTDGERVYVHFSMNDLYQNQMQVQQMTLTINGQSFALGVFPVTEAGGIDWGFYSQYGNNLSNGTYTNYGVVINYYMVCESDVAFTIYDSTHPGNAKGDEIEFSFSLKDFSRLTGFPVDNITEISIKNPNIGSEGPKWVGTSTVPLIGVAAAACFAGVGIFRKKSKKEMIAG